MAVDEAARYRLVITHRLPWWVGALYGPGLPAGGALVRRRQLTACELAGCDLCPDSSKAATIDVLYNFGVGPLDEGAWFRLARCGTTWVLLTSVAV
jgi:hypothetical protein